MRNAILLDEEFVVTMDNSGGIGEKAADLVSVPDAVTAYYSARVALLEQWAADGEPVLAMIHNFSGEMSWEKYVSGVKQLLAEAGLENLPISGSTETNMVLLQSAMSVTMIGKRTVTEDGAGQWFTYGAPLVGEELLQQEDEVASIRKLKEAFNRGFIQRIWPIGSKGILYELEQLFSRENLIVNSPLQLKKSAGPSAVVLVKIRESHFKEAQLLFGETLRAIDIR